MPHGPFEMTFSRLSHIYPTLHQLQRVTFELFTPANHDSPHPCPSPSHNSLIHQCIWNALADFPYSNQNPFRDWLDCPGTGRKTSGTATFNVPPFVANRDKTVRSFEQPHDSTDIKKICLVQWFVWMKVYLYSIDIIDAVYFIVPEVLGAQPQMAVDFTRRSLTSYRSESEMQTRRLISSGAWFNNPSNRFNR